MHGQNDNNVKATLFVTGASGFVGGVLLSKLDPSDFSSIVLMSRGGLELPDNLAGARNVIVVKAAIDQVDLYSRYLDSSCRIIHLAGITGKAPRAEYFEVNTQGTEYLVKAAERAKIANFLFVSSIAVSFKDRDGYHYAESKQQAEAVVSASTLNHCIVRPAIILGAGAPIWNSLSSLAKGPCILQPGDGKAKIQPIDVGDLADLLLELQTSDQFQNQILELGGPDTVTMGDFLQRIHRAYRSKNGWVIRLPLGMIMWSLRFFERHVSERLPVSSGQFTSFCNDGTIKPSPFMTRHHAQMNGIVPMLNQLLETESDSSKNEVEIECQTYTRYLTDRSADQYTISAYTRALQNGGCLSGLSIHRYDRLLSRLSLTHPILTRGVDGFCRFFYRSAPVRQKLIFLLAVLESNGEYAELLDTADAQPRIKIFLTIMLQSAVSGLIIGLASLVLLPLKSIIGQKELGKVRS